MPPSNQGPTLSGSLRLFQVFGVSVYVHWSWAVVALIAFQFRSNEYTTPIWNFVEYLSLFVIVLLHEFGHALACRQVGGRADEIVLWPLGGIAFVNPPPRPGALLWSIAAGPLVNVVLIPITVGAYLLASVQGLGDANPDVDKLLFAFAAMNFFLLIFNLLPIYPLDGGQILQALLWFMIGTLSLDVAGQEIMTADKVTLRLNALVTYRIVDVAQSLSVSEDARQALYRDTQLVLRALVGARELDSFLTDKDGVVAELAEALRRRVAPLGIEISAAGIRDVILPGDMKDLLNKVTEAKKAAEANLISRREETAAMRSQANTAKLLQDSPTLMRLRELEVLEKIAANAKLTIVLGEKGLTERVMNVL